MDDQATTDDVMLVSFKTLSVEQLEVGKSRTLMNISSRGSLCPRSPFFVVDTRVADCDPIMGESYTCAMSLLVRPRIMLLYFSYGYNEKWSHL